MSGEKALVKRKNALCTGQMANTTVDTTIEMAITINRKLVPHRGWWRLITALAVVLGLAMSIGLFFLLPTLLGTAVTVLTDSMLVRNLTESLDRPNG